MNLRKFRRFLLDHSNDFVNFLLGRAKEGSLEGVVQTEAEA